MARFEIIVFCVCLAVKLSAGAQSEPFTCYSCSYIKSSDPNYDIDCVKTPQNVTKGSPEVKCTAPNQCVTKATFDPDKKTVRSLTRACLPLGSVCDGDRCCNLAGVYPECELKCRFDFCNRGDAQDLSDIMIGDEDGSNSAVELTSLLSTVIPMSVILVKFLL